MGKSFGIFYELMCFYMYMYVRLPLRDGAIDMYEFSALWKYVQEWKGCFDRYPMYMYTFVSCCHIETKTSKPNNSASTDWRTT